MRIQRLDIGPLALCLGALAAFAPTAQARRCRPNPLVEAIHGSAHDEAHAVAFPVQNLHLGITLDRPVVAQTDGTRRAHSTIALSPSYFDAHANRVRDDLLLFYNSSGAGNPVIRGAAVEPPARQPLAFATPPRTEDPLEELRARDRLLLFRDAPPRPGAAVAIGVAMFAATTVMAAHAPRPLRVVFDGPIHLGPAIFFGGGMGAGVGGRMP